MAGTPPSAAGVATIVAQTPAAIEQLATVAGAAPPYRIETVPSLTALLGHRGADLYLVVLAGSDELPRLRELCLRGAPVIALLPPTADDALIRLALENGVRDCLVEPILPLLLDHRIRTLLAAPPRTDDPSLLRRVLDALPLGITVCDEDGQIIHLNAAEARMHGYEPHELLGHAAQTLAPDHLQRPAGINRLHRRWPWRRNSLNLRKNGDTFPVRLYSDVVRDDTGEIRALVTLSEDMTQQQSLDDVMQRQQEELRFLFEMSLDGLCFLSLTRPLVWEEQYDGEALVEILLGELRMTRINKVAIQHFGGREEEIVGRSIGDLFHADLPALRRSLLRLFSDGAVRGEWTLARRDGEMRQMEGFFVRLCDRNGHMTGLFAAQRDISERRRIERNLLAATRSAEQAARSKSQFLANMSHEIRTPLNGVLGMLQLLQMSELDAEQRECVDTAIFSGNALLTVINDILDFSKIEACGVEVAEVVFDPRQVLANTVAVFREQARRKGIALDWATRGDIPTQLRGDPGRIRQILFNLLGNAVKFTDQGMIRLFIENCQPHGNGDRLCFSVADSGIGIPFEQLERVFEPFTQADGSYTRQHQGTGLGLTIVRRLVEAMGGAISLESRPGTGTTVHFSVQVSRHIDDAPIGAAAPAHGAARGTTLSLLVVEDNPVNQLITRRQLEKMGHRVICAASGIEALAALEREECDIVLMDVQMPEMDGLEATRRLRACPPPLANIPVVAMTAHALPGDRERFLAAGMDDYLAKPVSLDQLRATLNRIAAATTPALSPAAPPIHLDDCPANV